jgi:glycosyltransferase involved in cell wall biosynthesis
MTGHVGHSGRPPLSVYLATPYGQDGMGGIDRLNDAIVDGIERHPELGVRCQRLVTRGKGSLWAAQGIFAAALVRLALAAARGDVSLLHIHLSVRGSSYRKAVLARLARMLGIPYVVHLHGTDYKDFWQQTNGILRGELGRMFDGSVGILVLGTYWAKVVGELQPSVIPKITVLPNATASVARRPPTEEEEEPTAARITFLGQLGKRKGSADLLEALARLNLLPGWTATLAGDGPVVETRQQVEAMGLAGRVHVPGWISTAERTALLDKTDMLVLPSYAENLPMVILEAFAHGVPVISTPVGAIPEVVVPGRNGLLVEPGDVPALAGAIRQLIEAPGLRREMGEAARQDHAARFEMERYLTRLAGWWTGIAASRVELRGEQHADV